MKFINQEVIDILTYRIEQEEYSSRVYSQMYLWLQNNSYLNCAKVWKKFSEEELEHAQLAKDYLMSFNIMPELSALEESINNFNSLDDIIQGTFDHEVMVTEQVKALTDKAFELKDWSLFSLAQEYTKIQIKEMDESYSLLDVLKLSNDKLVIDKYIGENF